MPFAPRLLAASTIFASAMVASMFVPPSAMSAVGRWHSWTNFNSIKALHEHQGRLIAGTTGGVRSIDPSTLEEKDYDNLSGLTDVRVVGLATDPDGKLWAASRSGGLFAFEGDKWTGHGRSYQSAGWAINDRAFFAAGPYLVIGSEKGLSFFDRRSKLAAANLTKFGAEGAQPVTGMLRRGDTLYIATGKAVLKASVDWNDILSTRFGTVFDPQIWKPAAGVASPIELPSFEDASRTLPPDTNAGETEDKPDTYQGKPVHLAYIDGKVVAHAPGALLRTASHRARALLGRFLFVDGFVIPDSVTEALAEAGGRVFMGSPAGLLRLRPGGTWDVVKPVLSFPALPVAALAARGGKVVAQSPDKVWDFDGKEWKLRIDFIYVTQEVLRNELRNLRLGQDGSAWVGYWGGGVFRHRPGELRSWSADTDPECLKPVLDPKYTVVQALELRGDDMWIALLKNHRGGEATHHHLAHMDLRTGKVTCPEIEGVGNQVVSLRFLGENLLGVSGDAGIHLYRWEIRDGRATLSRVNSLAKGTGETLGRDVALDRFGRLWGLFSEQLGVADSLKDKLTGAPIALTFPDNLRIKTCRDMETDARGEFWVGCDNGLFHVRPMPDMASPQVIHYTTANGLLANRVFDVAVDQSTGDVWVASEGGVNRLEGPSPPLVSGVSKVRAYPNPFLGKHRILVLDNLPEGSEASILTQGGSVVRSFRSLDMLGNQFQWDGNNAAGRKVKPGVYLWRVDGGGSTTQGKVIIAR